MSAHSETGMEMASTIFIQQIKRITRTKHAQSLWRCYALLVVISFHGAWLDDAHLQSRTWSRLLETLSRVLGISMEMDWMTYRWTTDGTAGVESKAYIFMEVGLILSHEQISHRIIHLRTALNLPTLGMLTTMGEVMCLWHRITGTRYLFWGVGFERRPIHCRCRPPVHARRSDTKRIRLPLLATSTTMDPRYLYWRPYNDSNGRNVGEVVYFGGRLPESGSCYAICGGTLFGDQPDNEPDMYMMLETSMEMENGFIVGPRIQRTSTIRQTLWSHRQPTASLSPPMLKMSPHGRSGPRANSRWAEKSLHWGI